MHYVGGIFLKTSNYKSESKLNSYIAFCVGGDPKLCIVLYQTSKKSTSNFA